MVALTGSRQTGKTTLVCHLLPPTLPAPPVYVSLDDTERRRDLSSDAASKLDVGDKLVVLDEVQKQPELLDAVKLLVDRDPRHRFILLGSSQIRLLQKVRETLAGRVTLLDLWPLALPERVEGTEVPATGIDAIWHEAGEGMKRLLGHLPGPDSTRPWRTAANEQLTWGGFPGLEPMPEAERTQWFRDFRETYLQRDLSDLGRVADLDQFALAQNLLAARTGQLLSFSDVARDLGVSVPTVQRWVRFLEISYQVRLLRPLTPSLNPQLVRSPKVYWTDPGFARHLTHRHDPSDGPIFESHVLAEILRWSSWQPDPPSLHFYRTRAGLEADFVLHDPNRLLVLEAKASERANPHDARPVEHALDDIRIAELSLSAPRLGLVVYRGRDIQPLSPRVWAIPDWRLFGPEEMG